MRDALWLVMVGPEKGQIGYNWLTRCSIFAVRA